MSIWNRLFKKVDIRVFVRWSDIVTAPKRVVSWFKDLF